MVGMILMAEAQAAGLIVAADGSRLIIRGPRSADALARRLLENKAAVLAALADGVHAAAANGATQGPSGSGKPQICEPVRKPGPQACPNCGSAIFWLRTDGTTSCPGCDSKPDGAVSKVVIITFADGRTDLEPFERRPLKHA